MDNKLIPILTGAVVLALVGGVVFIQATKKETYTPTNEQTQAATSTNPQASSAGSSTSQNNPATPVSYTLAQVAVHKDASSCWSAVNGNVYDLTSWIAKHPGGEKAILGICGKDGSAAFNGKHDGAKKQADILATFKIGVLK